MTSDRGGRVARRVVALQETADDPEDWAFRETEQLARLLAGRGDEAATAELRARADAGDPAAAKRLAELPVARDGRQDAV